jgi:hypothetical protein
MVRDMSEYFECKCPMKEVIIIDLTVPEEEKALELTSDNV